METPAYAVFLFPTVGHALKGENILRDAGIACKLIPVPRQISTECGVCLRVAAGLKEAAAQALQGKVAWDRTVLL
jgi:hypothetical protein